MKVNVCHSDYIEIAHRITEEMIKGGPLPHPKMERGPDHVRIDLEHCTLYGFVSDWVILGEGEPDIVSANTYRCNYAEVK